MRFMMLVRSTKESEAGVVPEKDVFTAMARYNEDLAKAGVLLAVEGLHPSSKGARVKFLGSKRTVVDGPFTETKELIAGFWLIEVKSREEAIEWAKRCPAPFRGEAEIELRQVFGMDDYAEQIPTEPSAPSKT
jgi:hypothetical protein